MFKDMFANILARGSLFLKPIFVLRGSKSPFWEVCLASCLEYFTGGVYYTGGDDYTGVGIILLSLYFMNSVNFCIY